MEFQLLLYTTIVFSELSLGAKSIPQPVVLDSLYMHPLSDEFIDHINKQNTTWKVRAIFKSDFRKISINNIS